jgi:hypothetical protein
VAQDHPTIPSDFPEARGVAEELAQEMLRLKQNEARERR